MSADQAAVGLQGQEEGRDPDVEGTDQRDLGRLQGVGDHTDDGKNGQHQGKEVLDQEKSGRTLYVVDILPSRTHDVRHMGEIGIQKDHLGRLDCRIRTRCHGNGTVRALHGQDVIDAVSCHGHRMAVLFEGLHDHLLLFGPDPSEDRILFDRCRNVLFCPQPGGIHILVRIPDAGLPGHLRYRNRIVSRYDPDADPLVHKVGKGLGRVLPDGILQKDVKDGLYPGPVQAVFRHGIGPLFRRPFLGFIIFSQISGKDQDAQALLGKGGDLLLVAVVRGCQDILRSPQHIGPVVELDRAVLCPGGEGHGGQCHAVAVSGKVLAHGPHGDIVVRKGIQVGAHQGPVKVQLLGGKIFHRDRVRHQHIIVRDRTCLVHAQNVDPGQGLNTLHVMEHDLAPGQFYGSRGQSHGDQKIKALRDHADDGGYHRGHAFRKGKVLHEKALQKEGDAYGDDEDAGRDNDVVDGPDHFRLLALFHLPGLFHQPGNVGIPAHMGQSGIAPARHDKAAGHKGISLGMIDLVRFTGQEGFVDRDLSHDDLRIGTDLISAAQDHHIVQDQVSYGDTDAFAVPDDFGIGLAEDRELIQDLFGGKLLEDSDQHVGNDNGKKGQ